MENKMPFLGIINCRDFWKIDYHLQNTGDDMSGEGSGNENELETESVMENVLMLTFGNTPGVALPNAGGPGTDVIYLLGLLITGLAGTGLVMRKRRRKRTA